jgi:hypothetical protein
MVAMVSEFTFPLLQIFLLDVDSVDFTNSTSETMVGQEFRIGIGEDGDHEDTFQCCRVVS